MNYPELTQIVSLLYNAIVINHTFINDAGSMLERGQDVKQVAQYISTTLKDRPNYSPPVTNYYLNVLRNLEKLKSTTMLEFYEKTASNFSILACRAGSSECQKEWTTRLYQEGMCRYFAPNNSNR